jgi:hypothetical protein
MTVDVIQEVEAIALAIAYPEVLSVHNDGQIPPGVPFVNVRIRVCLPSGFVAVCFIGQCGL